MQSSAEAVGNDGNDGNDNNGEGAAGPEFEDPEAYLDQSPDVAIAEFAAHPMMTRVQSALYDQLKRTHDRVMVEVLDREAALNKVSGRSGVRVTQYTPPPSETFTPFGLSLNPTLNQP